MTPVQKTAALKVPILPHTSPEAPQPPHLKTPLYPHQLRALHRCLLIEQDGSLAKDFGARWDFKSRGGCLADAVGMGKTATIIGLILSSIGISGSNTDTGTNQGGGGGTGTDTLVVAPGHLIPQWKNEILKFTSQIQILVGKSQYESLATLPLPPSKKHRVVLIDVKTILHEENKLWYDFRRVFRRPGGRQLTCYDRQTMETYKKAASFCVQSPRGPCSYEGWVYTSSLHLPFHPWRRVVFDEIQDLVSEGTESQKNLLQLSRTARNVWLLSATPFPHGNMSVYANHELLGFCRFRLDVEVDHDLETDHPFEIIKRKLYIRSPKHVADGVVTASKKVIKHTIYVEATKLERKFFELEEKDIYDKEHVFGDGYASLRQMMVHPEASKKLREQIHGKDDDRRGITRKGEAIKKKKKTVVGRYATVNSFAKSSLAQARQRHRKIEEEDIPNAVKEIECVRSSWYLALKVRQVRNAPTQSNPFKKNNGNCGEEDDPPPAVESLAVREAKAIHEYFCRCPHYDSDSCRSDDKAAFQTMGTVDIPKTLIQGSRATERIIHYFRTEMKPKRALESYIIVKERMHKLNVKAHEDLLKEKEQLMRRIDALKATVSMDGATSVDTKKNDGEREEADELAARHGSKTAALIRHLTEIRNKNEKTIVFSYWHDTLSLVHRSLKKCQLSVSFCDDGPGNSMSKAITDFTDGDISILLLSAKAKASGANLQVATNVILLDPAGSSAEHGATLEQQAVGRAVRMGQEGAVNVVRFCVKDTIEENLFARIDDAALKLEKRSSDNSYMCEDAHKALDRSLLETKEGEEAEGPEDFLVGESISARERMDRSLKEAEAKDEVIVIDDSEDEGFESDGKGSEPLFTEDVCMRKSSSSSRATVKVKTEILNSGLSPLSEAAVGKRSLMEANGTEDLASPGKRTKVASEGSAVHMDQLTLIEPSDNKPNYSTYTPQKNQPETALSQSDMREDARLVSPPSSQLSSQLLTQLSDGSVSSSPSPSPSSSPSHDSDMAQTLETVDDAANEANEANETVIC